MSVKKMHILACLVAGTSMVGTSQAAVLVNDTFSDNERATQSLPNSAAWYIGTVNAALASGYSAVNGNLDLPYISSGAAHTQLAYFTGSGSPIVLANVGDSLSMSVRVTMDEIASNDTDFRVGFFNSVGSRLTGDWNGTSTITDGYAGYQARFDPSGYLASFTERTIPNTLGQQLFGGGSTILLTSAAPTGGSALTAGTAFNIQFTLTRSSVTQITLNSSINGGTRSVIDPNTILTNFDTIAFFGATNITSGTVALGNGLTLDDVVVTFTPIPEPTTLAAVACALVLGLGRRRA